MRMEYYGLALGSVDFMLDGDQNSRRREPLLTNLNIIVVCDGNNPQITLFQVGESSMSYMFSCPSYLQW